SVFGLAERGRRCHRKSCRAPSYDATPTQLSPDQQAVARDLETRILEYRGSRVLEEKHFVFRCCGADVDTPLEIEPVLVAEFPRDLHLLFTPYEPDIGAL